MITRFSNLGRLGAMMLLAAGALYAAEKMVRYEAQPESKLRIEGTSTLHDWTVEGSIIGGFLEADPIFASDPSTVSKAKPKVEVTIPVRTIKSDKKAMDNVMHEAMKQKQHPHIKYRLQEMTLKEKSSSPNGPYLFDTKGELTVSGVTRTNAMVVAMEKLDANKLRFSGTNSMKMTDFGIKPPSPALALGLIKTGDDVTVSFEWVTSGETKTP
jgi:polyisoprenoid-binding protein YceI